jgi:hypothetical protein
MFATIIKTAICVNSHIERAITVERAADAQPVAARANCTASLDRSNSESSLAKCGPKNRATLYRAPNVLGTRCARGATDRVGSLPSEGSRQKSSGPDRYCQNENYNNNGCDARWNGFPR